MEKEMIRLEHISKKFGDDLVLREINASLHRGEILGFLGPSGAGKTTTIKIITGQLRQTSGKAYILGVDSEEIDESIYERIGIVTDNSGIYEYLTVYQNLRYFARILKVPEERIEEVLKQTGLWEHRKSRRESFPKGRRRGWYWQEPFCTGHRCFSSTSRRQDSILRRLSKYTRCFSGSGMKAWRYS